MSDVGAYRKVVLPSPKRYARMVEERALQAERAVRAAEIEIEAAVFDALLRLQIEAVARQPHKWG